MTSFIGGKKPKKFEKRERFLNAIYDIANYWKDKPNAAFGTAFSILVMFDGDCSSNDFEQIKIEGISNQYELHEDFCRVREEREKDE